MAAADGSVVIDTQMNTEKFHEAEVDMQQAFDHMSKSAAKAGEKISKSFETAGKEAKDSMDEADAEVQKILADTTRSQKSKAASIAAIYRKSGMSQSEAFEKAWQQIERTSGTSSKKVKNDIKGIGNHAYSAAAGIEQSISKGISKSVKKIGSLLAAAFASGVLFNFGKEATELGSDLAEVQNVVDVTFTRMNEKVNEVAKSMAQTAGLSETMAKRYIGTFGAMATSFGFAEEDAYEMSTSLTQLAGDVASFYNITQDEAYTKLKSVFTGETETLKDLGVVMTQTALDSYALEKGLGRTTAKMTEQEKVALRYSFVMDQLSGASGDFVRTSDSWANQTRVLKLEFESLKATLGQGLINVLSPALKVLNALLAKLQSVANTFRSFTESIFGKTSASDSQAEVYAETAEAIDGITSATEDAAEANKKAAKAQENYLSGLDQIRTYQAPDNGNEDTGAVGDLGGAAGQKIQTAVPKESETVLDHLNTALDKIIERGKELKDLFKAGFWDGFGDTGKTFKKISKNIKSIGKEIAGIFTDPKVNVSMDGFVNSIAKSVGKISGSIVSIGATIANNLIGGIERYISKNSNKIKDWLVKMFDTGTKISDKIGLLAEDIQDVFSVFNSETAQQVTANIIATFASAFMGVSRFVSENLLLIIDRVVTIFDENKERIKNALSGTLEGLESVTSGIQDMISVVADTILPSLTAGLEALLDILSPLTDFLADTFFDVWENWLNPALEWFGDLIQTGAKVLKSFWNDVCVPFGKFIGSVLTPVIEVITDKFKWLWNYVLSPLADFIATVFRKVWENTVAFFKNTLIPVANKVISVFQWIWNKALSPIVDYLRKTFQPAFEAVGKAVKSIINGIKNVFGGLIDFIGGVFAGDWKKAWEGIKNVFKGVWDALVGIVKAPLNLIIGFINGLLSAVSTGINFIIDCLNKLSFKVPDWVIGIGGKTFGFNLDHVGTWQVPYLAKGAVIPPNAPFMAVLGDQKQGSNIETPEALLRKIVREEAGDKGFNGTIRIPITLNGRTLFEAIIKEAELRRSQSGTYPLK